MTEIATPTAIVCAECGGDPRRSVNCKVCGGAGIGVASADGFLVWSDSVDDFSIGLRRVKRTIRNITHTALLVFGILSLALFVWQTVMLIGNTGAPLSSNFTILLTRGFWFGGHWFVTLFWVSLFVDCFFIFRLSEYRREDKDILTWKLSASELETHDAAAQIRANHRFDVAPYFSSAGLDVVENSYRIARDLKRTEIRPEIIFAAGLTSSFGALFLARLNLSFDKLKEPLARLMMEVVPAGNPPISISRDAKRTLVLAYARARANRRKTVGPTELIFQSFADSPELQKLLDRLGFPTEHVMRVAEWVGLREKLREEYQRFTLRAMLKPKSTMNRSMTAQQTPLLDRFSEDVTLSAKNGHLMPLVNRTQEMSSLFRGIESGQRSVVLVGEHGVGKSAIIEELARRMVEEDVPKELFDRRLVSVNVAELVASGEQGLAAERLVAMLNEVGMSGNIVLALSGLEALVGVGAGGTMDLAEILARELDKGYFIAVATVTPDAWTRYLERRSLATRFVKVDVRPLERDDALRVAMARSGFIEYQQKVLFSFSAIDKAVTLAMRYIHDVGSPENALNVLREAAVQARKVRGEHAIVSGEDVASVVHEKTNIPVEAVGEGETQKLLNLEERMHGRIVGQDEAVVAVSQALRRARAQLREGKRPIANFLFLGPTGVGKTELSKTLAQEMFGDESRMIRLDMSEYQEPSSVSRMIGSPGDERGGLLTEAVRKNPFAIVLLDEVEKAHPDILNLFLQVMDDGRLTDAVGRTVDFTNTVVIMTSNAGTPYIQAEVLKGTSMEIIKTGLLERELKGFFRPEFLNRFDGVIVFKPLTAEDVTKIARLLLAGVGKRLEAQGLVLRVEDAAVEALSAAGFDPLFGARPLRRVIQERVENQLADLILRKSVNRGDTVVLQADGTLRVEQGKA